MVRGTILGGQYLVSPVTLECRDLMLLQSKCILIFWDFMVSKVHNKVPFVVAVNQMNSAGVSKLQYLWPKHKFRSKQMLSSL